MFLPASLGIYTVCKGHWRGLEVEEWNKKIPYTRVNFPMLHENYLTLTP